MVQQPSLDSLVGRGSARNTIPVWVWRSHTGAATKPLSRAQPPGSQSSPRCSGTRSSTTRGPPRGPSARTTADGQAAAASAASTCTRPGTGSAASARTGRRAGSTSPLPRRRTCRFLGRESRSRGLWCLCGKSARP
ncbi:hypothetical protein KL939_002847 [Ogataea angusta]|nr:hypothetical protein KL939_002847 [Ogataea angusta]